MLDYVKDAGLQFKSELKKRAKTDLIVLHHSEGGASETVQSIHNYHLSKGHKGIDYNICVCKNGDVYWGRGLDTEGGHVNNSQEKTKGVNARSVGIVCLGNFNKDKIPDAQKESLKKLVADLVIYFKLQSADQIVSHKEIAGPGYTDCPGTYFPTEEIREYIRNYGKPVEPKPVTPKPTEPLPFKYLRVGSYGEHVKTLQEQLNKLGYKGANGRPLVCDGEFGTNTEYAVKSFENKKYVDGVVDQELYNKLFEV